MRSAFRLVTPLLFVGALVGVLVGAAVAQPPRPHGVPEFPPLAPTADVKAMLKELALPPLPFSAKRPPQPAYPFAAAAVRPYTPAPNDVTVADALKDPEKYPFQAGVARAMGLIRKASPDANRATTLITRVPAPLTDKFKKTVRESQDVAAVLAAELEFELDNLTGMAQLREKQSRRWQAHYDYAVAQLTQRLAAAHEYNRLLGDVLTETLPLLPDGSPGWHLTPHEKLRSSAGVKKLAALAGERFEEIASAHKGTPWAALAEGDATVPLGLVWQAEVR